MANPILGQDIFVTMEMSDGTTFLGKCLAYSVCVDGDSEFQTWTLELVGSGDLCFEQREERRRDIAVKRTAEEWRCPFCGAVNLREHRQCQACHAWRPFLYGGD